MGVLPGVMVGGFLTDPVFWLLPFSSLVEVENNCGPTPIIAETPPAFLADCWLFIFSGDLILSTLLGTVSKCCCGILKSNWKQNGSCLILASSWVGLNLKSKRKNLIPYALYWRISDDIFTTFPGALRNAEAKRWSILNELYINFAIWFSESCNEEYVSIGTSLATSVIISNTLLLPLRELTEEVSK